MFSNVSSALNVSFEEIFEPSLHTASANVPSMFHTPSIENQARDKGKRSYSPPFCFICKQPTKTPASKLLTITAILT